MIPLGTSAVTLGLGYIIFFNKPPFLWGASQWLVPMAHTLVALPFVVRGLIPAVGSIPCVLPAKCSNFGSFSLESDLVDRSTDYPSVIIVQPGVFLHHFSGRIWSNFVSITAGTFQPFPIAIFRFLSQPGGLNYGQAMAMSNHPDAGLRDRHHFH